MGFLRNLKNCVGTGLQVAGQVTQAAGNIARKTGEVVSDAKAPDVRKIVGKIKRQKPEEAS